MADKSKTVTVVGAGNMGGPIAAQYANAGYTVYLLDRVPKSKNDPAFERFAETGDRSVIARDKLEKMRKAVNPAEDIFNATLYHPSNADRIIVGNADDNLEEAVKNSSLIAEAIHDELDFKIALASKCDEYMDEGTQFHSNTSTIELEKIKEGRSDNFKRGAFIGHWFNPPRHMPLVELVTSPDNTPEAIKFATDMYGKVLGKHVEPCRDTPLFLGNRIGMPAVMIAATNALEQGITAGESDALLGKPFGMGDGFFGMADVVGLELVPYLAKNAAKLLPPGDEFHKLEYPKIMTIVKDLISKGFTGRSSGKGGFFRPKRDEEGKSVKNKKGKTVLQSLDLTTGEYVDPPESKPVAVEAGKIGPRAVLEVGDKYSDYAWSTVRDIILYALNRVPEIADHIEGIDAAMRTGYNWKQGPFELLDEIGVQYFTDRLKKDGITPPPLLEMAQGRNFYTRSESGERQRLDFDFEKMQASYVPARKLDGVLQLEDVKHAGKPVITHKSASTWDIGDGVLCLEFHSKMNTMDPSILYVMNETIKLLNDDSKGYKGMVIYNDAKDFSVGANIGLIDAFVQAAKGTEKSSAALSRKIRNFSGTVANGVEKTGSVAANSIWDATYNFVDNFAYAGQPIFKALRECTKPIVAAPRGKAWGGGCEVFLHCSAVLAVREFYPALVEAGVGLIPGWGGTLRLLERMKARLEFSDKGPFVPLEKTFRAIAMPQFSGATSAQDAFYKGWMRHGIDEICANPEHQLSSAKDMVLSMHTAGYKPPEPAKLRLPGAQAKAAFKLAVDGFYIAGAPTTWYDLVVTDALGDTLAGGDNAHIGKVVTEEEYLHRERENFASLTRIPETMNRIHRMIVDNKPFREGPMERPRTIDEIRALRQAFPLPQRPMTGKPLDGEEGKRLKRLADLTAALIDYSEGQKSDCAKNLMRAAMG